MNESLKVFWFIGPATTIKQAIDLISKEMGGPAGLKINRTLQVARIEARAEL